LVKNWIFSKKLDLWSKIGFLVKNRNCVQFIEIVIKNPNFGQKLKICSEIEILVKSSNFGEKLKIWPKI